MTLKDFRQLNVLDYQIRDLKEKVERARAVAEKCTVTYRETPGGSNGLNSKKEAFDRMCDLEKQLASVQEELTSIIRAYNDIDDRIVKAAINLKYDVMHCGKHPISWNAVARRLGGALSGDGIRMSCKRYFEKNSRT